MCDAPGGSNRESCRLGQTYASRLHLMAFLPASFVCAFALSRIRSTYRYRLLLGTAWLAVIVPTIVPLPKVSQPAISPEACLELRALSVHIPNPDHTLIVARHGLEWWAAWALETKVARDFAVEPDAWQKYKTVLFLRQSPQTRTGGSGPFPDVVIPQEAEVLHRGLSFSLARVSVCPRNYPRPKPNSARRNRLSLRR